MHPGDVCRRHSRHRAGPIAGAHVVAKRKSPWDTNVALRNKWEQRIVVAHCAAHWLLVTVAGVGAEKWISVASAHQPTRRQLDEDGPSACRSSTPLFRSCATKDCFRHSSSPAARTPTWAPSRARHVAPETASSAEVRKRWRLYETTVHTGPTHGRRHPGTGEEIRRHITGRLSATGMVAMRPVGGRSGMCGQG